MAEQKLLMVTCADEQDCTDMHRFSGIHYVYGLHYISGGKGTLTVNGKQYPLKKGQVFLYRPGEYISYCPDENDPYFYKWVGFQGLLAESLVEACAWRTKGPVTPVMEDIEKYFDHMRNSFSSYSDSEYRLCNPDMIDLLSYLIRHYPAPELLSQNDYVSNARDYILANFHKPELRIQEVAVNVGVSRSALFRAFTKRYGVPPMKYLENIRIKNAKWFLAKGNQVKNVAKSCGYNDALYFSAMFKKAVGISPTEYQINAKQNKEKDATVI
jgi:AraC-like DNA-binding protein